MRRVALGLALGLVVVAGCGAREDRLGAFGEPPASAGAYAAYARGAHAEAAGALDDAAHEFEVAARLAPDDVGPQLALGRVQARRGALDAAQATLDAACARFPSSPDAFAARARLHERRGRLAAARADLGRALALAPRDVDLALAAVALAVDDGDLAAAARAIAPAADAGDERARLAAARVALLAGDATAARRTLAAVPRGSAQLALVTLAHAANGEGPVAGLALAAIWRDGGASPEELHAIVTTALALVGVREARLLLALIAGADLPWSPGDRLALAREALSVDDAALARRIASPTELSHMFVLAEAQARDGDLPGGLAILARGGAVSQLAAARLALGARDLAAAEAALAAAASSSPSSPPSSPSSSSPSLLEHALISAELAEARGDLAGARAALDRADALAAGGASARIARAALLARHDQLDAALALIEPMLAAAPDDATWLNLAGYLRVMAGARLAEAEPLLWRALELAPDDAAVLDSWGMYLLATGRLDEAHHALARAARLAPGNGEIRWHLATCVRRQGNAREADAHEARARALGLPVGVDAGVIR